MPVLLEEDLSYPLPEMLPVKQHFDDTRLVDVRGRLLTSLHQKSILSMLRPGMRTAVAVGSRGIDNLALIVQTTIRFLTEQGCRPFIVSAMGSHGGGTPEGQKTVLEGYGITEEAMGVPVITDTDTICIGSRGNGLPVYWDAAAANADLVIPINRIKLHTDFEGPLQSGLCKMLAIGLGDQKGCSMLHETAPEEFAAALEETARLIIKTQKIGFGVGIMENALDHTCHIEAIPASIMIGREKELARDCVRLMPFLRIQKADILIVDEIGKEISGAGYDPNILGRSSLLHGKRLHVPEFQRMVLLDVTEKSHGNAIGLGQFDVITKNVFEKMDFESVYANALAVRAPEDARIPVIARDREEAVRIALKCCRGIDYRQPRILEIHNTLSLQTIYISPAMLDEVWDNKDLTLLQPARL